MTALSATKSRFVVVSGLLSLCSICLAVYVFTMIRSAHASSQPSFQRQPMGLRARRAGNELRVAWDTQSPSLVSASEADLVIDDGPHKTQLSLSQNRIRTGSIRYSPYTGTVVFHLTALRRNHKNSVETLQVTESDGPAGSEVADDSSQPSPEPVQTKSGTANRRIQAASAGNTARNIQGSMIVHGYVVRGTLVDVRIPVDSHGRPLESLAYPVHKKGVMHYLSQVGKAPARLWPFHHREEPGPSR